MAAKQQWGMTRNPLEASKKGYIGEEVVMPTPVAAAVRNIMKAPFRSFHLFYYGTPTTELRKKFNIPPGKIDRSIRRAPHAQS